MPKTAAELREWVVEYNQNTTHDRVLNTSYGYNRILDSDLVSICAKLRAKFEPPIRVLDIGCGSGKAISQLADQLDIYSLNPEDFDLWGIGVNRYDEMFLPDDRLILEDVMIHDFAGQQFHLITSVFAFHYIWHKLEALEKIHNELLVDGGRAILHLPGYLVRYNESPESLYKNEADGNQCFKEFMEHQESSGAICPMNYRMVPNYSDDDDCVLLAEFGNVRFEKEPGRTIHFNQDLRSFGMFENKFTFQYMNVSERTYVVSYYATEHGADNRFAENLFPSSKVDTQLLERDMLYGGRSRRLPSGVYFHGPYSITSKPFEVGDRTYHLDIAVHEYDSERVILICPGACEPLAGRLVAYAELAEAIVQAGLGAVVRYSDPFDHQCDYQEFLRAKTRCMMEFALETASHFCKSSKPRLNVMAYSSSAGAIAKYAAEFDIETLLLIAPSRDLPHEEVLPAYQNFEGNVRVLVGEADQVVLPQQAFWYYDQATHAATREYVEARSCGHSFDGPANKLLFFHAPLWAFGDTRPIDFPKPMTAPSEAWC